MRIVRLIISLVVHVFDNLVLLVSIAFDREVEACLVVLTYHAVRIEEKERFSGQMESLVKWSRIVDLHEQPQAGAAGRMVAITFDDAFAGIAEAALETLEARRIPCAIFVPTGWLGKVPGWVCNRMGNDIRSEKVMSREQIKGLCNSNFVSLGAHGRKHIDLTTISETEAKEEIVGSMIDLESLTGRRPFAFSFPYGKYSDGLIRIVQEAGYDMALSTRPNPIHPGKVPFVYGRVGIEMSDTMLEFRLKALGAYRWLPVAICLKQRLRSLLQGAKPGNSVQEGQND